MNSNVLKAILAMDSYNRGYDQGIIVSGAKIGNATIISDSFSLGTTLVNGQQIRKDQAAGFYGISYQLAGGEKVISYRGTDTAPDLEAAWQNNDLSKFLTPDMLNGYGVAIGSPASKQAELAIKFYQSVAGSESEWRSANISLTGHSLGGGLAGLVGSLYNRTGLLFNNMAYQKAADNAHLYSTEHIYAYVNPLTGLIESTIIPENTALKTLVYGTGAAIPANYINFNTIYMDDEFLTVNRALQNGGKIEVNLGYNTSLGLPSDLSDTQLHSMATMVMQLFANTEISDRSWEAAAKHFWPVLYSNAFAQSIGMDTNQLDGRDRADHEYAAILRQIIAYSAIDEGATVDAAGNPTNARPFGDTAIRAFYNDANDLGKALNVVGEVSTNLICYADEISKTFIQYAGQLALSKTLQSVRPDVLDGVLEFGTSVYDLSGASGSYLSVDLSPSTWAVGTGSVIAPQYHLIAQGIFSSIANQDILRSQMLALWGDSSTNIFDRVLFGAQDAGEVDFFKTSITDYSRASLIIGGNQSNTIIGTNGKDLIMGGQQDDILYGNDGDDIFVSGQGNKKIFGGSGYDSISYAHYTSGINMVDETVTKLDGTDQLYLIEKIALTNSDDIMRVEHVCESNSYVLDGLGGNDTLTLRNMSLYHTSSSMGPNLMFFGDGGFGYNGSPNDVELSIRNIEKVFLNYSSLVSDGTLVFSNSTNRPVAKVSGIHKGIRL